MAHITLNTNTTTSPAALALPDNARIVIIDTDTNTETADLVISGAESLIVADDDVQITTTATAAAGAVAAAEKVVVEDNGAEDHSAENHSAEDTDTGNTETSEAPNTLTVSHNADIAEPRYSFCLIYNKATGIYTDSTTGTEVATDTVIDIIDRAYDNKATTSMTFDIPGRGITNFTGNLVAGNYNGYGITLVGVDGGAYVLNAERELSDDMTVLEQACFIFAEDPEVFFDGLDVNIAYDIVDVNNIRTYDADAKLYTKISSQSHNLNRYAIHRIVEYAATHDLSARLQLMNMEEEVYQPYVGRLQPVNNDPDNIKFIFVDKKLGKIQFKLDNVGHDFVLEVYSDTDMRRRGFAGTNHADYDEVSIVEMVTHINTRLSV